MKTHVKSILSVLLTLVIFVASLTSTSIPVFDADLHSFAASSQLNNFNATITKASGAALKIQSTEVTNLQSKTTDHIGLSFRLDGGYTEFPNFCIRLRATSTAGAKKTTSLISFWDDGSVGLFQDPNTAKESRKAEWTIASYAKGSVELYFDITIKWASTTSAKDGSVTITAYVNGVCAGTFEKTGHNCIDTGDFLQIYAGTAENAHLTDAYTPVKLINFRTYPESIKETN